jgi:hypothetical protein
MLSMNSMCYDCFAFFSLLVMLLGPLHHHLILHYCLTPARRPPSSPPHHCSLCLVFHSASVTAAAASIAPPTSAMMPPLSLPPLHLLAPCEFVPCSLARNRNVTAEQESRRSSGIGRLPAAVGAGDSHARALRHTGVGCRDFLRLLQLQLQFHDSTQVLPQILSKAVVVTHLLTPFMPARLLVASEFLEYGQRTTMYPLFFLELVFPFILCFIYH